MTRFRDKRIGHNTSDLVVSKASYTLLIDQDVPLCRKTVMSVNAQSEAIFAHWIDTTVHDMF